ncbi:MAG TPA: hypothetical protein VFF78_06815 [Anaerolineaceae bacterium]|nr:hypothetical protein [Anaerolineaceae bacterium]
MARGWCLLILLGLLLGGCASAQSSLLLEDTNCAPPCWRGITPGQTSKEEALQILTAMDEVKPDSVIVAPLSERYPESISATFREAKERIVVLYLRQGKVAALAFWGESGTAAQAVDFFGLPEVVVAVFGQAEPPYLVYSYLYPGRGIRFGYRQDNTACAAQAELRRDAVLGAVIYFDPGEFSALLSEGELGLGIRKLETLAARAVPWTGFGWIEAFSPPGVCKP